MGTWKRVLGAIALGIVLLPMAACGNSTSTLGASDIQVDDITSPFAVFVSTPFTITGANFLSVVGTDATVRFTATGGVTPFAGGTSATTDVPGTVTSNTQVTGMSPTSAFVGSFSAYVTVILPSTASGTSATPIAEFIGVATDAVDDSYDAIGNTRLTRDAATGVLVNDDPAGFTTVIGFDAVSTNGGDVAVAPDGAFTYDAAPGFEGIDTFTYEISGGIGTDTATVTITVTEMVWFIDSTAAPGGDGRQETPFDDVAPFMAIQGGLAQPGDTVFLYRAGGAPYTGPLTLLADQVLLGQGVDLVVGGQTLETATGNPLLTGAGGTTLTLGANNTVRGLDIGNTAGAGISGLTAGSLALDTVNVSTPGGKAVVLDGQDAAVTFGTLSSTGSPNTGVEFYNMTGSVTVSGGTTVTNPAIVGVNVAGGTAVVTFQGVNITATSSLGLVTAGTVQVNVTGTGNSVTTTTGTPVIVGGTIGTSGITFESVSCDGAPAGIQVVNSGTLGGFTVTGDGTGAPNGSGGTLLNCTGNAIDLVDAQGISLTQLDIDTSGGHGIHLQSVTDFLYEDASIVGAGDSDDEYGIYFQETYGDVLVEDVVFDDVNETGIQLTNAAGDDSAADVFTFRRVDVQDHTPAGFGEHGMAVQVSLLGDVDVLIDDCTFDINGDGLLGVLGVATDSAALTMTVRDCTFDAGDAFGSGSIQLQGAGNSQATFNVLDNDLNLSPFTPILVNNDDNAITLATIRGNDVDADVVGNNGFGISLRQDENGSFTALVEDNTIDDVAFDGIRVIARDTTDGTGTMNVTLLSNTVGLPSLFGAGIYLSAADANTLCANVSGNAATGSNLLPGTDDDIVLTQSGASSLEVTQDAPTGAVSASELDDANNGATVGVTGVVTWSQPACPVPPVVP